MDIREQEILLKGIVDALRGELNARLSDYNERAKERSEHYDRREDKRDSQVSAIADSMVKMAARLDTIDQRGAQIMSQIDALHESHRDLNSRVTRMEGVERRINEHLAETENHHAIIDYVQFGIKAFMWVGAAIGTLAAFVAGILPLLEKALVK